MTQVQAACGLLAFFAAAWLLSERRKQSRIAHAFVAIACQLLLAAIMLRIEPLRAALGAVNGVVVALQSATEAGTSMVFGYLGGAPLPFEERMTGSSFVLAFRALPLIVLVAAPTARLTQWRVLPAIIGLAARALRRVMGLGSAAGFGVAANVVLGMVEAPLTIGAYLASMSRSDLFVLMTTGMATIAGTVWVLYASVLAHSVPDAAGHLLVASVISLPAAVGIARLMVPEDANADTGTLAMPTPPRYESAMDAITQGTQSGVKLLINVIAMLLVLVALVHLVNVALSYLPTVAGEPISLQRVLGIAMWPLVWLMGVPAHEALIAAELMGIKTVLNELLAYLRLAETPASQLGDSSRVIMTYALCGFANPGSLGILIAGFSTMAPTRRAEIVALGPRSLLAGTLATSSTAAVVALIGPG